MHELKSHPDAGSAFLTLTYDNKHLPYGYTLQKPDYQNFLKRLRKITGPGLRFFGCGEYGEKFGRPHYHIILFNYRPPDCKLYTRGAEHNLYTSQIIDSTWQNGEVKIGDVTFDSCAYTARYCMKKQNGPQGKAKYTWVTEFGDKVTRSPEFSTRSQGIGLDYYKKYQTEILTHDNIIMNGLEVSIPRYYDKKTEETDANMRRGTLSDKTLLDGIKAKRRLKLAKMDKADNTNRRRVTKEIVMLAKLKQKARIL